MNEVEPPTEEEEKKEAVKSSKKSPLAMLSSTSLKISKTLDHPRFSKEDVLNRLSVLFNEKGGMYVQEEETAKVTTLLDKLFEEEYSYAALRALSQEERREKHLQDERLVYAEADPAWFVRALLLLRKLHGHLADGGGGGGKDRFWDPAAGAGKLGFAAALVHNFEMIFCYEILESLSGAARRLLIKYDKEIKPTLRDSKKRIHIELQHRDALAVEGGWESATLVFVHACWRSAADLETLQAKLERMPAGALAITVAKPYVSDGSWERLLVTSMPATWGQAVVYIWEKTA